MSNELLLCTDLDRTLIPNGAQRESLDARKYFRQLVQHPDITLAYVTGRDKNLVKKAIAVHQLPIPDYVIADVGASIYKLEEVNNGETQWHLWHDWQLYYANDWKGKFNTDIALLFSGIKVLRKQEVNKQKKYKLSYYIPLYINHEAMIKSMQETLTENKIAAELIWSVDEPLAIGLLDVMPKHATKRNAIEFLMQEKGFDLNNTLFAGDSGNDLDVLTSPIRSILVANAHKEVKETLEKKIMIEKGYDSIYLAHGGYKNMNGNYSAGILEGVQHYIPDIQQWFEEHDLGEYK